MKARACQRKGREDLGAEISDQKLATRCFLRGHTGVDNYDRPVSEGSVRCAFDSTVFMRLLVVPIFPLRNRIELSLLAGRYHRSTSTPSAVA